MNKAKAETPKVKYLHGTLLGSKMVMHAPVLCGHIDTAYSEMLHPRLLSALSVSLSESFGLSEQCSHSFTRTL